MPHPSCKRAGESASPSQKKIWYPTRDSNPENRASEARAYSDSASGAHQNKSPGTLRLTRARRELPAIVLARRSPPLGARACPPRSARRLSAVACRKSPSSCGSSPFQRQSPNGVDDPKTKKPGALARSGLREISAIALAVSRVRTRTVLAALSAISREAFPAHRQG